MKGVIVMDEKMVAVTIFLKQLRTAEIMKILFFRLHALVKVPGPVFIVRWSSKIVTANNRVSGPNDAAVHSAGVRSSLMWLLLVLVVLLRH
jgi:hypothetical protein